MDEQIIDNVQAMDTAVTVPHFEGTVTKDDAENKDVCVYARKKRVFDAVDVCEGGGEVGENRRGKNDKANSNTEDLCKNQKKRRVNEETLLYTENHKAGSGSCVGREESPKIKTIDDDVNEVLTPYTYNSVAKKPKKPYIHRPGVKIGKRFFEEPSPSGPVYVKEDQKLSELEKITKELLKFMYDFFKKDENQVAVDAIQHFQQRIQKCGVTFEEDKRCRNKLINYNLVQKFRPDGYGGVAIGVRKKINISIIEYDTDYDILIIKTSNLQRNVVIVSVYFPPTTSNTCFIEEVSKLLLFLENFQNVILCGDFNARNEAWGDNLTSIKGRELRMLITEAGYLCLNNGKKTFKGGSNSQGSVPDLTFLSNVSGGNWNVLDGHFGGSRHLPITFEIKAEKPKGQNFLHKAKLMKALGELELEPDMLAIEDAISSEIKAASNNLNANRSPKYWWNDSLSVAYRNQLAALKKARKYPNYQNLSKASQEVENWKMKVKTAKNDSFLSKINELNRNANPREAWKFVNNVRNRESAEVRPWNNDRSSHFLQYLKDQVPGDLLEVPSYSDQHNFHDKIIFDFDHFEKILSEKKKGSAGGHDKITYEMIKALPGISKRAILTALYNAFLENSINDNWRIIKIVPIPKPNKDLTDMSNYRPISLISVFMKVINLMLKDKLVQFIDDKEVIPARSFAYRKSRSTSTCLNEFLHRVALLKANNYKVLVLSLDINNAYNCVRVDILGQILRKLNFNVSIVNWIINFLSKRILRLGDKEVVVKNGLPQGSCLSPLLFNIYTANLHKLEDNKTLIFQYADDFLLMVFDHDFDMALQHLQTKAVAFQRKCGYINLSFNPEKSKTIYFAKNSTKQILLNVDGCRIEQVKKMKFLGRIISNSLSVKDHYSHIKDPVSNRTRLLKCLNPPKGGLHPKVSLNLYKSLVRAKVDYGRTTTANSPKYVNNNIERLQNEMIRRSLGVSRSTPNHVIYALAGELPPKYRAKLLTTKEILKIKLENNDLSDIIENNPLVKSSYSVIYHQFEHIFRKIKITSYKNQRNLTVRTNLLPSTKNITPNEVIFSAFYCELSFYKSNQFCIFATDASVNIESTGCGVYNATKDFKFLFKIDFKASSMFGELFAIKKALEIATEDGYNRCVIFTDSLTACKALNSADSTNYLVAECHNILERSSIEKCHIVWIPAHRGIRINEEVDLLAKQASLVGAPVDVFLTPEEAYSRIENLVKDDWNEEFIRLSESKGSHFFQIINNIYEKPWFSKMIFEPSNTKLINRLITGHTSDKKYLHRIGAADSNLCETCAVLETAHHLIFDCTGILTFGTQLDSQLGYS
ncbi:probable RNA-directed DNA polymerase from transposon BS isoform X3 [Musca domestica]|uniref:Probable RNA-directed DNA polymerase from transposon BS isoform X3 n=1 Tax=Musca domestica TaxID=7370 RepID=A0ABM3VNA5_MUSDO|nr:probable RNA-directed DNA polymerase from transposon BS isoform X3 [Musca domestica]